MVGNTSLHVYFQRWSGAPEPQYRGYARSMAPRSGQGPLRRLGKVDERNERRPDERRTHV